MIQSFGDETTKDIFHGVSSKKALKVPKELWAASRRKLDMLNAAHEIVDLKVPPGNRLEKLEGKWKGRHSIRINGQYRVVFEWTGHDAANVQIVDYH